MKTITRVTAVFATILMFSFSLQSCYFNGINNINGNGNVVKQDREVSAFSGIDVGGKYEIVLTQGEKESLSIEADENLLEYIETKVKDGVLYINSTESIGKCKALVVNITFKELDNLDLSGACDVWAEEKLAFDRLEMECSGASEIDLKINATYIEFDFSGASEIKLEGEAGEIDLDCSGASEFYAEEFEVENYTIDCSGASSCRLFVTNKLDVESSGASSIRYKGNPQIINKDVSGAASIKEM